MIDLLVALGILAIYFGAGIGILSIARTEVWHIRRSRAEFYQAHVDKVTRLERAKETDLISTIYTSATLRAIYSLPDTTASGRALSQAERSGIDGEIEKIKAGLKGVTDARGTFDGICNDFDLAARTLWSVAIAWFEVSLVVPFVVVLLTVSSWGGLTIIAPALLLGVFYFGAIALATPTNRYRLASSRLETNQASLKKMVEETIYGLPATSDETPPASGP